MAKKIIFRADGNSKTGLGHLYRLFSLVEMIKDHFDVVFLTNEESTSQVVPCDYNIVTIPKNITIKVEPKWIRAHFSPNEYSIIADGYSFDSIYQQRIKEIGYKLIYIDDLAKENMYADIVINHSPFLTTNNYTTQPYTQLALGTQYALLRPKFLDAAQQKRKVKTIDTAFVCFGGSDPFNLTTKATQALLANHSIKHIHIVLGGAYKHESILDIAKKHPNKISIHRNLSEQKLVEVMNTSHFAIAPASTILFELCCVKMPILSGYYVDNQELIYRGFLEKGAIYDGENMMNYENEDFSNKIESILKLENHDQIIKSQNLLFDGGIKSRYLNLISKVC